jgi:hypothetical protein
MKNSIKLIAAAALVATSGFASAAIDDGYASGNGELFFRAYDSIGQQSYIFDTGVTMSSFLPATAASTTFSLTNFATFLSTANVANTTWGVYAIDGLAGTGKIGVYTTGADSVATNPASSKISAINDALKSAVGLANIAAGNSNIALNNSVILSGASATLGSALNFNGFTSFPAAVLLSDNSQAFYAFTNPSSLNSTRTQFANANGVSSWNIDTTAGTLSFVTATAPVPEPSTYALAIAGLAVVGALARRKKAAK